MPHIPGHGRSGFSSGQRTLDRPTKEVAEQRDRNMRVQAAKSMAEAGIKSLGGAKAGQGSFTITDPRSGEKTRYTTTTNEDDGSTTTTTTNEDGGIISQVTTDEKGNLVPQKKKTNLIEEALSGGKDFFEKYLEFGGITGLPVALIRLLTEPKSKQFTNPNDLAIIRSLFTNVDGTVNKDLLKEYYDDYEDIIREGIQDRGVGSLDAAQRSSNLTGNFGDFENLIMSSSPTGIPGMESERRLDPVGFFTSEDGSFNIPQTTGQAVTMAESLTFDDIMKSSLSGKEKRRLGAALMEARALANDARSREARSMGQGIMAASPALPGISVPTGGTISPTAGGIVSNPVLSPVAVGNMTPTIATGITPFNINQFYASLPQYTQQGIMSPNLSQFYQNLGAFPRV